MDFVLITICFYFYRKVIQTRRIISQKNSMDFHCGIGITTYFLVLFATGPLSVLLATFKKCLIDTKYVNGKAITRLFGIERTHFVAQPICHIRRLYVYRIIWSVLIHTQLSLSVMLSLGGRRERAL